MVGEKITKKLFYQRDRTGELGKGRGTNPAPVGVDITGRITRRSVARRG